MHTIREALLAMGYRECAPGKWLKPVGFQLLSYSEERNELANWFGHAGDPEQYLLWNTETLKPDHAQHGDYLFQLKYWECFTKLGMFGQMHTQFHLRAIDL